MNSVWAKIHGNGVDLHGIVVEFITLPAVIGISLNLKLIYWN